MGLAGQPRAKMMHACILVGLLPASCEKSGPLADVDAASPWPTTSMFDSGSPTAATVVDAAPQATARPMPPRPVPTSSPTVRITMPQEVQLQAIQYMAAMQAPQPNDAPADADYANQVAMGLKSLGQTDVVSSGRRIVVKMAKGCDATLPRGAIARGTGATLTSLLAHGVLVVECIDHSVQCLQSTRDATDVLCTHR